MKKLLKTITFSILFMNLFLFTSCHVISNQSVKSFGYFKQYEDIREKDLSGYNLVDQSKLLYTLTFDTKTKWPEECKLPKDFDPAKLLEYGKDPGLNIRNLQKQGYTGKGVTVACVDQYLLVNHEAYNNVDLHYFEIQERPKESSGSMHGPAVLSLLAGKEIGIVPNATVYYFGLNGDVDDNEYEARAFEKIIELNKTLPENKKIRIVGMSHAADDSLNKEYAQHLRTMQAKARESGIIVVDVIYKTALCGSPGFKDKNIYKNYELSNREKAVSKSLFKDRLIVPAVYRTTAAGYLNDPKQYIYWTEAGASWTIPYITGVIAMGLQIDPNLDEENAFKYLHESAHNYLGGDLINPEGFLDLVKKNLNNGS